MPKPIAAYTGGVQNLIEIGVRSDGVAFRRYQEKGRYGYKWSAWKIYGDYDVDNLPGSIEVGFSTVRIRSNNDVYLKWQNWRLPK